MLAAVLLVLQLLCLAHTCMPLCRLPMIHQNSMRFYDDIVYDREYNGLVLDEDEGQPGCLLTKLLFCPGKLSSAANA